MGVAGAGAAGPGEPDARHVAPAGVLAERAGARAGREHGHHRAVPAGRVAGPALARDVLLARLRVAAVDADQPRLLRAVSAAAGPPVGALHGGGPGAARRAHVHVHAALLRPALAAGGSRRLGVPGAG